MVKTCHVLGLEEGCSKNDASKVYRQKSLELHPDKGHFKTGDAGQREIAKRLFNIVKQAYEDNAKKNVSEFELEDTSFEPHFVNKDSLKSILDSIHNKTYHKYLYQADCSIDYNNIFEFADGNNLDEKYQSLKSKPKFSGNKLITKEIDNAYGVLKNNVPCSNGYQDKFLRAYFVEKNSGFVGYLNDLIVRSNKLNDEALKSYDPSRFFLRKASTIDEAFKNIDSENFSKKEIIKDCLRYHLYREISGTPEALCGRYTLRPEGTEATSNINALDTLLKESKFSCGLKITKVELLHARYKVSLNEVVLSVPELIKLRTDKNAINIDCDIDYYKILGLEVGASSADIKNKVEELKTQFTDHNFLLRYVNYAYSVLKTEESRKSYLDAKNDYIQNKNSLVSELFVRDKFLQKYFVEQDNGLVGAFNKIKNSPYISMDDTQLKEYDIIRHTLKNNPNPEGALAAFDELTLTKKDIDFSAVKKCLEINKTSRFDSMDLCGQYSLHKEGIEEFYQ